MAFEMRYKAVENEIPPRQGEKRIALDLVVAEKKDTLLGAGLPVPMVAGKSGALEDGVAVVVFLAVGIYSAAVTEGTPAAAAVHNKLNFGPYI